MKAAAIVLPAVLLAACSTPATMPDDVLQPPVPSSASASASAVQPSPVRPVQPPRSPAQRSASQLPDESALPADLAGTWTSSDGHNAALTYRFDESGAYRFTAVLIQQRASGQFSFEVDAAGTARATATRLTLRPERGSRKMTDPDSSTGGWERPVDTEVQVLRWRTDGDQLLLTDAEGATVTYRRQ